MSTTPPPDPDRPEQPEPDQQLPDQPAPDPWVTPPATGDVASSERPAGYPPPAEVPPQVPYGATRPKPTPPPSILTAVRLMYAGAALSVISFLVSLFTGDSVRRQIKEASPDLSPDQVDTAVVVSITFSVFVGLIAVLLWLWMAAKNRSGRSWARIVATILGGLNIVLTLFGLFVAQNPALVTFFSVISVLLAGTILYFLYRPDSNAYYEAVSEATR